MTKTHVLVLKMLRDEGPQTAQQIAARFQLSPTTQIPNILCRWKATKKTSNGKIEITPRGLELIPGIYA